METKLESLTQYIDEIAKIEVRGEGRMSLPKILFRGQAQQYAIAPSLGRRPSPCWANSLTTVEKDLVRSAQQKFPLIFPDSDYPVILLAKLQHYGIPTRMLDVTDNALVALYFACDSHNNSDGEVFVFQAAMLSAYDPIANIVADTYRLTENATTPIENYYYRALHRPYATRWLYPEWEIDMKEGCSRFMKAIQRPLFVEAGNVCERQKNQSGKFILFPNQIPENALCVRDDLVTMERNDPCILRHFKIASGAKSEILRHLKLLGITRETLFSDDVDVVLKDIVSEQRLKYPE